MINNRNKVITMEITIPEIVIVEEMRKETAKQKVLNYMREHKKSDIIELHKNIRCDIRLLVEIIDELRREGKIEGGVKCQLTADLKYWLASG